MRRVSSRQRLVSWDAFDAAAVSVTDDTNVSSSSFCYVVEDEEESYITAQSSSYDSLSTMGEGTDNDNNNDNDNDNDNDNTSRRRKRDRKSFRSSAQRLIGYNNNNIGNDPKTLLPITRTISTSTSSKVIVPTIIPSYSWEISKPLSSSIEIEFDNLIDDLHIVIFSFLDLSSLRSVMSINRHYRQLMLSNDARSSLWIDHCQKIWHISTRKQQPKIIDNFRLPIAASFNKPLSSPTTMTTTTNNDSNTGTSTNTSLLLSLTPTSFPSCVDEDLMTTRMQRYRLQYEDDEPPVIQFYQDTHTGHSLVKYTGPVGQGDRCIRSNHPLPRPSSRRMPPSAPPSSSSHRSSVNISSIGGFGAALLGGSQHFDPHRPFLMNLLRCGSKSMMGDNGRYNMKSSSLSSSSSLTSSFECSPFVVPFVDKSSNEDNNNVNVTPRFISYYEVNILKMNEDDKDEENDAAPLTRTSLRSVNNNNNNNSNNKDCVAVGLATESFRVHSRMPGWDRQSFGYHGDDGGIFHSSGGMLKSYGPKFGSGDTVGCGIDYISKGIFYTLNGKFLGYAFKDIDNSVLQTDLYPVVGLDTNCPIHVNFGTDNEAFQFDLSNFIMKHERIVRSKYSIEVSCAPDTTTTTTTTTACTTSTTTAVSNKKSNITIRPSSLRLQKRRSFSGKRNHRDRK